MFVKKKHSQYYFEQSHLSFIFRRETRVIYFQH